ncbi:hypothetical protein [Jannaschia rubra]|uniref:hypothetical protein n=1 Tax=Jannaschia rubra TaxID=282197 RepID=UPI0024904F27|nr:hypothetical protein [Jannaschia rubra]
MDGIEIPIRSCPSAPLPCDDPTFAPQAAVFRHASGGTAMPLPEGCSLQRAQDYIDRDGPADIDISVPEFSVVQSSRVYMILGHQCKSGNDGSERVVY